MEITPDQIVYWSWRWFSLNATIVFTWAVMALLTLVSWLVTRRISESGAPSRWQSVLEVIVLGMREQVQSVSRQDPGRYLPFVGTLFLFIATSNTLGVLVPGFHAPTGSLATTAALAVAVMLATPVYGIAQKGVWGYFRTYAQPTIFMLPFNLIGELSRTLALAVRLYGNIMSGAVIVGILLSIAPFFFPIVMELLGLLTGLIQAYIFAILAMVYIASATRSHQGAEEG